MHTTELAPNIIRLPDEPSITPLDLYCLTYARISSDNITYTSGPITSGGAKILPGLTKTEVATRNKSFYLEIAQGLAEAYPDQLFIVPHLIGSRQLPAELNEAGAAWGEVEYLTFWLMVIARVTPDFAALFFPSVTAIMNNRPEMNNHGLTPEERQPAYDLLLWLTLNFLAELNIQHTPVSQLVSFPDSRRSLGSSLEQHFASRIVVPVVEVSVAEKYLTDTELFSVLQAHGALRVHEAAEGQPVRVVE